MSMLKQCDFCDAVQDKADSLKCINVSVSLGTSGWGGRNFDMCPDCQTERDIVPKRTTEVHAQAVFEELIRDIVREEIEQ